MIEKISDRPQALLEGCNAAGLIAYQDDAIVSRILAKAVGGTVTLFAFDKGQLLSEHKTRFDALVYMVDGTAEFTVDGKPHRVSAGDALLLPADIPHAVTALERFRMLLIMMRSGS